MSAPRKKWDDHSARWKREKTKQGLIKSRWDSWFKLSAKSRKFTDPYKYAAGQSVAEQRMNKLRSAALANMRHQFPLGRVSTMRLGIDQMTAEQLRWTAKASGQQLRKKASVKVAGGNRNLWWYR